MPYFEKQLHIRKSTIPGAGKGLFTKKYIPKKSRIVEYKGRIQSWEDVKHEDGYNNYLMRINRKTVINAKSCLKKLGRYTNDASGLNRIKGLHNNAEYVSDGERCFIEALRNINPGEEILVGYGKAFWDLQKKINREENRVL